jgi:hypothetical protein
MVNCEAGAPRASQNQTRSDFWYVSSHLYVEREVANALGLKDAGGELEDVTGATSLTE